MSGNKFFIGGLILFAAFVALLVFSKGGNEEGETTFPSEPTSDSIFEDNQSSPSADTTMEEVKELKIEDLRVGSGEEALPGKTITVNYKGTLTDGSVFDSSYDRGDPFIFSLGAGEVIQGWDLGFEGMKVGGKRKLTIPSDLAYGPVARPGIPANSTLIFEVELLEVK